MAWSNCVKRCCPALDWTWVKNITAFVLTVAAMLKAWQFAFAPLGVGGRFSVLFPIAVVEFELAFALLLFFGVFPKVMRRATICLFALFGVVSAYKAVTGEASCGCFGDIRVHPLLTTVLDVSIIAASGLSGLKTTEVKHSGAWVAETGKVFVALLAVVCSQTLLFGGDLISGDTSSGWRELSFSIERPTDKSAENTLNIVITNKAGEELAISGARGNCSSGGFLRGIPVTLQPGGSARVVFVATDLERRDQRAKQKQRFVFYVGTDHLKALKVVAVL